MIPPETPIWSDQINFPAGVLALTLPWTTSVLLSPLGFFFGPVDRMEPQRRYDSSGYWCEYRLVGSSVDRILVYWLCDGRTGDDSANAASRHCRWNTRTSIVVGGTPSVGNDVESLQRDISEMGVGAGLMAVLVALDSPYHAIYAALTGLIVLPWSFIRRWKIEERLDFVWTMGSLLTHLCCWSSNDGCFVQFLPFGESSTEEYLSLWKMNAADLRVWWRHDFGTTLDARCFLGPNCHSDAHFVVFNCE